MRLLVLADLHGRNARAQDLLRAAEPVDALLLAGDITHFGPPESVVRLLEMISCPIYAVPGNCDPPEVVSVLERNHLSVDGRVERMRGFSTVGLGGSNHTPYGTPLEFPEEQLRQSLGKTTLRLARPAMLLSHVPPQGILDSTRFQTFGGSMAVREFMSAFDLVVCGHIHEARGIHEGPPKVVNCGPALAGYGAVVEFADGRFSVEPIRV